ncbi:hypothetical protein [Stigmatella aurantiaca]|uniref:hypothetical protein n=1 Tax=Stigmatella aurantiaca TaxID=41 RepID=UPI001FE66402|nr:hypothetical protein [Stigmatella aurantiaca]
MSWGDVCTAYYSTGIPDITVFCEAIPSFQMMLMANRCFGGMLATEAGHVWLEALARVMPQGPTEAQRAAGHGIIVAEAEDERGHCFQSRLRTPEVYTFTCTTGLAIVERVLAGDLEVGFQTPARVYGPDFILAFEGVSLEDLSAPEVSVNGHTWAAGPAGN